MRSRLAKEGASLLISAPSASVSATTNEAIDHASATSASSSTSTSTSTASVDFEIEPDMYRAIEGLVKTMAAGMKPVFVKI